MGILIDSHDLEHKLESSVDIFDNRVIGDWYISMWSQCRLIKVKQLYIQQTLALNVKSSSVDQLPTLK